MTLSITLPITTDIHELACFVEAVRSAPPTAELAAQVAKHLANSGDQLSWTGDVVDIASTGGPGSLSTLLTPLLLRSAGETVVKLAVPGRPAGAIDALGTLHSYRTRLSPEDVTAVVNQCAFAHFLANERFAPLDAALFSYRRASNALAIPVLVTSSLLSKKLAVGVNNVGLDIRVGEHGNFGSTLEEARENAKLFCRTGELLGIRTTAFITTGRPPAQPFIGRGESLVALAVVLGLAAAQDEGGWLAEHLEDCRMMVARTSRNTRALEGFALDQEIVQGALESHLQAQGSSLAVFVERVQAVQAAPTIDLVAERDGFLDVDLSRLRASIVKRQECCTPDGGADYSDPCGLQLQARPGAYVLRGAVIAKVRHNEVPGFPGEVQTALVIRDAEVAGDTPGSALEVIVA